MYDLNESVDSSLLDMLESVINPTGDRPMFNALEILASTFTVEFTKIDGSLRSLTGKLVAPNYEGSNEDLLAYCASLEGSTNVPVYTAQGWRSFNPTKAVAVVFAGTTKGVNE